MPSHNNQIIDIHLLSFVSELVWLASLTFEQLCCRFIWESFKSKPNHLPSSGPPLYNEYYCAYHHVWIRTLWIVLGFYVATVMITRVSDSELVCCISLIKRDITLPAFMYGVVFKFQKIN